MRREDVTFFREGTKVERPQWVSAETVEMRFRASKGDQLRKGTVVTRSRDPPSKSQAEQKPGAVELLIELMSHDPTLPRHAPLVAYRSICGSVGWWTQRQATQTLGEVVALAGVQLQE